ncbi:glycosyltransferase [Oceanobacillus massiliensis]|uniref:glycosyltransferase n=1 Tax=Oceanobacillus massiliensis TaxID=1465765 RepID=UPI000289EC67|nr:glycosyltransferase [Oceanobacillus massiliensis]
MLNLLFIAEDSSFSLNQNFYYLERELADRTNLMIWRKPGPIRYILKGLPVQPDFILLMNDLEQKLAPAIKGLENTGIPTGLFVNDVHRFRSLRKSFIERNKIPYLFTVIRDHFLKTYPGFKDKMIWLPHFVNTALYKDYGLTKEVDFLMMGAVNKTYPLREKILKTYSEDNRFVYHKHPGYGNSKQREGEKLIAGTQYARELNRSKIFFTCPSRMNYPVLKYYEALACKTLLLAPSFKELEDLGFIPGHHFIAIDESNFKEKAEYYLTHKSERQLIAEQGYDFIHQEHSLKKRAQQLVNIIEGLIDQ